MSCRTGWSPLPFQLLPSVVSYEKHWTPVALLDGCHWWEPPSKVSKCFAGLFLASVCVRVCECTQITHAFLRQYRPKGNKICSCEMVNLILLYIKHKHTCSTYIEKQYICGLKFSWEVIRGKCLKRLLERDDF